MKEETETIGRTKQKQSKCEQIMKYNTKIILKYRFNFMFHQQHINCRFISKQKKGMPNKCHRSLRNHCYLSFRWLLIYSLTNLFITLLVCFCYEVLRTFFFFLCPEFAKQSNCERYPRDTSNHSQSICRCT